MTPETRAKQIVWSRGFNHYTERSMKSLATVKKRVQVIEEYFDKGVEPPNVRRAGEDLQDAVVRLVADLRHFDTFCMDYFDLLLDVLAEERAERK